MKNLKKVLALVLALVMVFGAVVTSNAAFKDAEKITADYSEAVDVLSALKVLEGFPVGDDYEFRPQDSLTRAQAAKVIAIFDNGATDIKELYAARCEFTDVAANHWARSYIGYCAHEGLLTGIGNGKYDPEGALTGVAFLKMVLNVLGYDTEKEGYTGAKWAVNVLAQAKSVGLMDNMASKWNAENVITREEMAQIMFNALLTETVEYGYVNKSNKNNAYVTVAGAVNTGKYLAEEAWRMYKADYTDKWGRPGYQFNNAKGKKVIGPFMTTPKLAIYKAVEGCDLVEAGIKAGTKLDTYFNGYSNYTKEAVTVKDVAKTLDGEVSAQGRLTEVYADRIVYIDTYLARVDKVYKATVDAKGHTSRAASVVATVFDSTERFGDGVTTVSKEFATDKFSRGDFVLVNVCNSAKDSLNNDIAAMELATAKNGKVTALSTTWSPVDDVKKIAAIDGTDVAANITAAYTYGPIGLADTYLFYYDKQGNVIGKDEPTSDYFVIDKLYKANDGKGGSTYPVTLVDPSATKTEGTVSLYDRFEFERYDVSTTAKDNDDYYYNLVLAAKDADGNYEIVDPNLTVYDGTYVKGNKFIDLGNREKAEINANTKILFQSTDSPDGTFTAYVGYAETPSMSGDTQVVYDVNGFASIVYIRGQLTSSKLVFIPDVTNGRTVDLKNGNAELWLNGYVLEEGKMTATTIKFYSEWSFDYPVHNVDPADVGIYHAGLYRVYENGAYAVGAEEQTLYVVQHEIAATGRFALTYAGDTGYNTIAYLEDDAPFFGIWTGKYDGIDADDCLLKGGAVKLVEKTPVEAMADLEAGDLMYIDFKDANENGVYDLNEKVLGVYQVEYPVDVTLDGKVVGQQLIGSYFKEMKVQVAEGKTIVSTSPNYGKSALSEIFSIKYDEKNVATIKEKDSAIGRIWAPIAFTSTWTEEYLSTWLTVDSKNLIGATVAVSGSTVTVTVADSKNFKLSQLDEVLVPECKAASKSYQNSTTNTAADMTDDLVDYAGKADLTVTVVSGSKTETKVYNIVVVNTTTAP